MASSLPAGRLSGGRSGRLRYARGGGSSGCDTGGRLDSLRTIFLKVGVLHGAGQGNRRRRYASGEGGRSGAGQVAAARGANGDGWTRGER